MLFWFLNKKFKPEYLKQVISKQISQLSHKKTEINGDIKWEILPSPQVTVRQIEIGDSKTQQDYYLNIEKTRLKLQLSSLLTGKFRFNEIKLNGARLKIYPAVAHAPSPAENKKNTKDKTAASEGGQFAIDEFKLSDSQIEYIQGKDRIKLNGINLKINAFSLETKHAPIELSARLKSSISNQPLVSNLNFKGHINLYEAAKNNMDLTKFQLTGKLNADKIQAGHLKMDRLNSDIQFKNGTLNLSPLTVNLYSSTSKGEVKINLNQQLISFSQNASGLDTGRLLNDFAGMKFIQGKLDYMFTATMPMNADPVQGLKAKGQVSVREGALQGIDVEYLMTEVSSMLIPLNLDETNLLHKGLQFANFNIQKLNSGKTAFNLTSMSWMLVNGLMTSDNIILSSDRLDINGQGRLDLIHQQINSQFEAKFKDFSQSSKIYIAQEALGGSFPVVITGPVHHPQLKPDLKILNPIIQKIFLNKSVKKSVDAFKKNLKSLLK